MYTSILSSTSSKIKYKTNKQQYASLVTGIKASDITKGILSLPHHLHPIPSQHTPGPYMYQFSTLLLRGVGVGVMDSKVVIPIDNFHDQIIMSPSCSCLIQVKRKGKHASLFFLPVTNAR